MGKRRIWVQRPHASPTLVQIAEDDLVDDVRDAILQKYGNSLGKTLDAADVMLHIVRRANHRDERVLGPEEDMCRTLDAYYPGGQTVEEALIISVPSTEHSYQVSEDLRPPQRSENDYYAPTLQPFPPATSQDISRSMSVLNSRQGHSMPSPGSRRQRVGRDDRPEYSRQRTKSPVMLSARHRRESTTSVHSSGAAPPPSLPRIVTSEPPGQARPGLSSRHPTSGPPKPTGRNGAGQQRNVRGSKVNGPATKSSTPVWQTKIKDIAPIERQVFTPPPPINVLIVEDNNINLRLLVKQMKRLEVRWDTATNGQIAVDKWRAGGFHLVLMDIQMDVMNGLQATKEIRRLERVNAIGSLSSSSTSGASTGQHTTEQSSQSGEHNTEGDILTKTNGSFKSSVIIVALTASSLESDRHEALTAGCNDFLTKPVGSVWLEQKIKEWGCMQALIDFDGWQKWKDKAT